MTRNKIALLVHGFNVRDRGVGTVGRLRFFFTARGWDVINFDMGWMGLIQVRTQNKKHAQNVAAAARTAKTLGSEVIAVGHSNGCRILHHATSDFDAPIDRIAYINPALDPDLAPGRHVDSLHVYHSPSDKPVRLARYLPSHTWGNMGAVGYLGEDPRVFNFNKEIALIPSVAHSDFADEDKLPFYGPLIVNNLIRGNYEKYNDEPIAGSMPDGLLQL